MSRSPLTRPGATVPGVIAATVQLPPAPEKFSLVSLGPPPGGQKVYADAAEATSSTAANRTSILFMSRCPPRDASQAVWRITERIAPRPPAGQGSTFSGDGRRHRPPAAGGGAPGPAADHGGQERRDGAPPLARA